MDVAAAVGVGFGSAVVGAVVGAIASFLGLVHIERQRVHRTRVGVVRAVVGELRGNAGCAVQVRYGARGPGRIRMRFSSETWQAAKFDLAQFVGDDLFRSLLFVYDVLPMIERVSEEPGPEGADDPVRDWLDEWVERVKEAMIALLRLPEAATFRSQWEIRLAKDDQTRVETLQGE